MHTQLAKDVQAIGYRTRQFFLSPYMKMKKILTSKSNSKVSKSGEKLSASNLNIFYLMRLVSKSYFKNPTVMFTDFILPIIIMSVLYNVLNKVAVTTLVPGIILSPIVSSSFLSFTVSLVE